MEVDETAVELASVPVTSDFGTLLMAAARLERVVDRALQEEAGVTHVMFEVLLRLFRAESRRLPIGAIDLLLTSGGMTRLLDRMERAGLVRRVPHPSDRRVQLIEPTTDGKIVFERAAAVHTRVLDRYLVAPLTPDEYAQFVRSLRRIATGVTC